jgi:CheY-like chemotaxis protein/plastocyanin
MGRVARKVRGAAAVVLGVALAIGLASTAFAGNAAVKAIGFGFTPSSVTVTVGGMVTWTNGDGVNHTATADDGSWDTSTISSGSSASMTFNTAGTFPYHCAIHASMHGTVVVDAATAPATDAVVLYVEDNRLNRELLRQVLKLRPALTLLCAVSGEHALTMAQQHAPQLLLIDWHLGDMDGAALLQRLRAEAGLGGCPAVVLTADVTPERHAAALRAGFDAYLAKPFGVADLLSCLDRLVGPPPTSGFMALR